MPIDESDYLKLPSADSPASADDFDVVVPEERLWVLGDNRYSSKDSRYNQEQPGKGFVPVENVVGRAFLITWPLQPIRDARLPPRGVRRRSRTHAAEDAADPAEK